MKTCKTCKEIKENREIFTGLPNEEQKMTNVAKVKGSIYFRGFGLYEQRTW